MSSFVRTERKLAAAIDAVATTGCPPGLAEAVRYAVFPGGARVRPRLCLAVAKACGDGGSDLADAAAAAIEFMHCASLAHDDLPAFDNAAMRRGVPTLHRAFGEPLAVLAGDALIVLAFEVLARAEPADPRRVVLLVQALASASGLPAGIVAGQAWESEPEVMLAPYQQAKTGALFALATCAGAIAAGVNAAPWRAVGEHIGAAYQIADDIRDVMSDPLSLGKDIGRDAALGRPNAVRILGLDGAVDRLRGRLSEALSSIPECAGAAELRAYIAEQAERLLSAQPEPSMRVVA